MREQKNEPTPAKGLTRIGNRNKYGDSNLGNLNTPNNEAIRREIATLKHTLVNGYSTYLIVLDGLQSNFEGVRDEG